MKSAIALNKMRVDELLAGLRSRAMSFAPSIDSHSALSASLRLARAIVRTENLDDLYAAALDALTAALRVDRAAILLFEPDGVMRFKASRGLSDDYRRAVEGHTPWKRGDRSATPVTVPDVAHDPSLAAYLPTIRRERIAAMAFVPLEGAEGVIGKFMLYYGEPHEFSADELHWAGLIAAQVAFAVELTHTERERALEFGRSHEISQRLAAIVKSSDDAIVSKDLNGIIQSWNRGAERMYGYSAEEAIGRSINIIVPTALLDEEEQVLDSVRHGTAVEIETMRQHKNGALVPVSLAVSPVKDATGRIVGVAKIARDIGLRKRHESQQAELHRRLTALVQASASLLHSLDSEAVQTATLKLAEQLLRADGYALWATDVDGSAWRPLKTHGLSSTFAERVLRSSDNAAELSFSRALAVEDVAAEPLLERHREQYRAEGIHAMLVCPMRLHGGRVGTLVFYYRDQHTFTDADVQAGQALANIAAAALTTADLYVENASAYQRARDANRVKDEFLATLSHELRTPLNAILGYAQMLELRLLSGERQVNAVAALSRNAEALKQIIGDVLDVSRITSGKLRLDVRPVELETIARNALATVQPAADAKRVTVRLSAPADVPLVTADPDRLQQVVWNLLSNAVKFTQSGGDVRVRLDRLEHGVQISVSDNGRGIEADFLPHIFERFRQADSRFSREHGGLGLGLAIAKELVEMHGGTIAAFSDGPGTGTTFTVQLPSIPAPARMAIPHDASRLLAAGNPAELSQTLSGIRVLAVDDEEDARQLLRIVLESAGANVTTAESGFHALELLEREAYDILLADIGMPRMDGLQLIEQIRNRPSDTRQMPALALTAFARAEDRKTALAKGFQRHVAKPVQPTELVVAIAELVQQI